ncbi:hypothetical protein M3Y95_00256200 [Aphelenchoides besseyi]|nr:hypothetical protein M3Y95_00256200 [Aphelenchoides besseyi]
MNLQFFVLASISWILYQCYTAIFLGFMVDIGNLAIAPLFAVLFMLVVGSLFSVIVTHFTPRPAIYNIPEVVDLNRSPLWHIEQVRQELISLTGCNEYHAGRICTTCRALKPERASHCWMCNSCYPRMDHHCVVMGTCVHYKNHKQFNLFIFWLVVTNFFCLVTTVPFVQLGIEKLEWTSDIWIQDYIIRCVNYVVKKYLNRDYLFGIASNVYSFSMTLVIVLTGMLVVNGFFVGKNITYMGFMRAFRLQRSFPFVRITFRGITCYDRKSWTANFRDYFGPNPSLWLFPLANDEHDGWNHRCLCEEQVDFYNVKIV